jgi:enterochelin esterase-like enzyme
VSVRASTGAILAIVAAAGATVAFAATTPLNAPGSLAGTIRYATFKSTALQGTLHYSVYLPPGYGSSGKRYPVIYFLHGLPGNATDYRDISQVAAAVEASGTDAIVIGAQGARDGDTDPEWLNWGVGRNWEAATATDLVAVVDYRYRTIAERAGRLLVGISAGGYGATLIALHHPGEYAVVESWSGYFHATNPNGTAALQLASVDADDWANAHKLITRAKRFLSSYGTRTYFAFYVGKDDSLFRAENEQYDRELKDAGLTQVVFKVYAGGHNWSLWEAHASAWLARGLSKAAKPL